VVLVILPFWTSFLIRIYAWMNILQHDGPLNQLLLALHIVREPPAWLSTNTAVYIGIVYSYLPFMVLPLYVVSYMKSLQIAAFSTLILLVVGYPIAYAITRTPPRLQAVLVVLVILPFWTSFLIRIYAWMNILQHDGPLNQLLLALHIVREPPAWLSTNTAVYIGIVYSYLPFMVLPLYAALEKLDQSLLEAAADLGCPRWRTFWAITLPLSAPGVIAGSLLCFIPIVGEFVIPDLLGGSQTAMIGQAIWSEFFANKDWPTAAAVAVILVCLLVTPIVVFQHQAMRGMERD